MELKINPKFRDLLPPLTEDEFDGLEKAIIKEGCRHPIVIWNETIVDGHNRYKICTKHNLKFNVTEMSFANEEEAGNWIIQDQFSQRNLEAAQRTIIALKWKKHFVEKGLEKMSEGGKKRKEGYQNSDNLEPKNKVDAIKEVAKLAGVSHDTVHKVEQVLKKGSPELVEKMSAGEISIHAASQAVADKKVINDYYDNESKKYALNLGGATLRSENKELMNKVTEKAKEILPQAKDFEYIEKVKEVKKYKEELEKQESEEVEEVYVYPGHDLKHLLGQTKHEVWFCHDLPIYPTLHCEAIISQIDEIFQVLNVFREEVLEIMKNKKECSK